MKSQLRQTRFGSNIRALTMILGSPLRVLIAAGFFILLSADICWGAPFSVGDLWGKKDSELVTVFPNAKKSDGDWEVRDWNGWEKVVLIFDTKSGILQMIFFTPVTPLSENDAKEIAQKGLGLELPSSAEVRAIGLIAYRDMKGKISTINFTYKDSASDRRIGQIAVFLKAPPMSRGQSSSSEPERPRSAVTSMLGQTLSEWSRRYGKPEHTDSETVTFRNDRMSIRCRFFKDRCESIGFTQISLQPFSDREFQVLREANSGNEKWLPSDLLRLGGETWESSSMTRFAVRWGNPPYTVFIHSREALERMGGPFGAQIESAVAKAGQ